MSAERDDQPPQASADQAPDQEPPQENATPLPTDALDEETLTALSMVMFSGPLPPPQVLSAYDEILPGSAKDMHELAMSSARAAVKMAEAAQEAEILAAKEDRVLARRGQTFAFTLALALVIGGLTVILMDHDGPGTAAILAGLGVVTMAFLRGRQAPASSSDLPQQPAREGDESTNE